MSESLGIPEALIDALRDCQNICILTGSGVSAESGVPTFRDAHEGLWAQYDPQELATPEAFLENPGLVWDWYRWRRQLVSESRPNPGHLALAELQYLRPSLNLITQNVDGLHQQAGSHDVVEFHGNLFADRCFAENCVLENVDTTSGVPKCPECGGLVRPGVVWFGEAIPRPALESAASAVSVCEMFISIGTSSMVWPAAGLTETAASNGAITIEINPNPTPMSDSVHYQLAGNAGVVLPELIRLLTAQE